jgi:hypothetical protein
MAQPAQDEETVAQYRGLISIEWPAAGDGAFSSLRSNLITITDAVSGKPVTTCSHADIIIRADAEKPVTADLTLFASEDGEPLFDGRPVMRDGEALTGVFPFLVAGMRVRDAP